MHSIHSNSNNEGCSFIVFKNKFLQICNEHKKAQKALAFAFILYDFTNPQISKILNDADYWVSLNKISGSYLTVFSFHYKPIIRYKSSISNTYHSSAFMTTSPTFNNPSDESNALINQYFGTDIKVNYPSVLFFQVYEENVIDYELIELKEEFIESSFIELKGYIQAAVDALSKIMEENRNNNEEIFDLVRGNVKHIKSIKIIKKVSKKIVSFTELFSSILGL